MATAAVRSEPAVDAVVLGSLVEAVDEVMAEVGLIEAELGRHRLRPTEVATAIRRLHCHGALRALTTARGELGLLLADAGTGKRR